MRVPQPPAEQPGVGVASDSAAGHLAIALEQKSRVDFQGAMAELLRSLALKPSSEEARRILADA
jgi:hypothetical protein